MSVKCQSCQKVLNGQWNMTTSNSQQQGRYLGINDGYFLNQNNPNFVFCYCQTCWQQQILQLPFVNQSSSQQHFQQQINAMSNQLQQKAILEQTLHAQLQQISNSQQAKDQKIAQLEQELVKLAQESVKRHQSGDLSSSKGDKKKQDENSQGVKEIDRLTKDLSGQLQRSKELEDQFHQVLEQQKQQLSSYAKESQEKEEKIEQLQKRIQEIESGQNALVFNNNRTIEKDILIDVKNLFKQVDEYLSYFTKEQQKELISQKIQYEQLLKEFHAKQQECIKEASQNIKTKIIDASMVTIKSLKNTIEKLVLLVNDLAERLKNEDSIDQEQSTEIVDIPKKSQEYYQNKLDQWILSIKKICPNFDEIEKQIVNQVEQVNDKEPKLQEEEKKQDQVANKNQTLTIEKDQQSDKEKLNQNDNENQNIQKEKDINEQSHEIQNEKINESQNNEISQNDNANTTIQNTSENPSNNN